MGVLPPGCSESQLGAVLLEPWAPLSPRPGWQCGSSWVTCAHSLPPGLETGLLTSAQYLTVFFLLLRVLESVKNFCSHSSLPEASESR